MYKECLKYPFQPDVIHKKKRAIKRELLLQQGLVEIKIAILGGSTTSAIRDVLELFLLKEGFKPIFYESGYNQYYEDALFGNEALLSFCPDIVYIHTTTENISNSPLATDTKDEVRRKLAAEMERFSSLWERIARDYQCSVIQNNFELPCHRALGNLDFSDFHGKTNFLMNLNMGFSDYAQDHQGFYINDIHYLSASLGLAQWHDRGFWYSYKYALSYDAIVLLAHNVATIAKAIYGKSKKCLILDLDNTLWGGVIGDDGPNNIKIGKETAVGEAYTAFQEYVKGLKDRGVILAVCSKNDLANASEGFDHPDSILRMRDFASFKANWDPKHDNIKQIAQELNIGVDSLVFVDDNPAERALIRAQLPEVEVPEVGDDIVRFVDFIDKAGYFEPSSLSGDDTKRGTYYQQDSDRERLQTAFADYSAFLRSLEMKAEIGKFSPVYLDRITQLINKTNQFNLTTKRVNAAEVVAISRNSRYLTLYGRLSDKFGDNGLTSVIIGAVEDQALRIDNWLMSCRVMKRDFELAMFDALVARCKAKGLNQIVGYYLRTSKNEMVADHYANLGFELLSQTDNGDTQWRFAIPINYENRNELIEVKT